MMNVSRNFVLIGTLYLIVGLLIGMYMAPSEDFTLAPLHAHMNLLGFVLATIFGLAYKVFPDMAASGLAKVHFWAYEIGVLGLVIALYFILTQKADPAVIGPVAAIFEVLIVIGVVTFGWNAYKNLK